MKEGTITKTMRPLHFDDFLGQDHLIDVLKTHTQAALKRKDPLDHVLLSGPPGLGKTTIAHIIAQTMGGRFTPTSGPILKRAGDLAALLTRIEDGGIFFIDEIHRLPPVVEEMLYGAMEDGHLDILTGVGAGAESIRMPLPPFTLIGATTRSGLLTTPLRERFQILLSLDYYQHDAIMTIIKRYDAYLGKPFSTEECEQIAQRARGVPRIALRIARRFRDYRDQKEKNMPMLEIFYKMGLDEIGLEHLDLRYLMFLTKTFGGGPTGVEALSAALGESKSTLESMVEPYLLRKAMIMRTRRGRVTMEKGFKHLKIASLLEQGLLR